MKEIALTASPRTAIGKGSAHRTRAAGNIPAVVYGPEIDPLPVTVTEQAFRAAVKSAGGSAIFNLQVDGKSSKVIIRELQRDPVTSRIIHIDFHAISMTKPLHLSIPIHFVGTARGVKTEGGIMQTVMRELEISCLPTDIPEHVEVDVTNLGIGGSIHVRDLSIPKAQVLSEPQSTVVVISAPTIMKVEVPVAEAAVAEEAAEAAEAAPAEAAAGAEPKAEGKPTKAEAKPTKAEGKPKPEAKAEKGKEK